MASASSSSSHLTTAMALVASSRRPKRRSLSEFAAASAPLPPPPSPSSATKRRRSSLLRRPRHLLPPSDSSSCSSSSSTTHQYSNLHLQIVPSAAAASPFAFVKTDPIPNLSGAAAAAAVPVPFHDAEDVDSTFSDIFAADDDDPHLHRVPSFFAASAADHLLIDVGACKIDDCSRPQLLSPSSADHAPILRFSASPISPLSHSDSAVCSRSPASCSADDQAGSAMDQPPPPPLPLWEDCDEDDEQESCDYLSHGFYEMETGMRSIMGDGDVDARSSSSASHFCLLHEEVPSEDQDAANYGRQLARTSSGTTTTTTGKRSSRSTTVDGSCGIETDRAMVVSSSESAQQATSSGSLQSTTTTLQLAESDEEYRIDLTDFDIPESSGGDRKRKALKLTLNYEEIASEWSDRGPVRTDGRWPAEEGSTELDLSEWEAAAVDAGGEGGAAGEKMEEGASEAAEAAAAAAAAALAAQRQASVLRYREKRRTRLFAKKIRYEVRKLNAERRPRMKGRFIKRSAIE